MTMRSIALGTWIFGLTLGCESATEAPLDPMNVGDAVTATYSVTFESAWSASSHPTSFPTNPHFSGLIGATHSSSLVIWEAGGLASTGIKNMAELGSKAALQNEVNDFINAGTARSVLSGGGIGRPPGSVELTFEVNRDSPLVTLVSMLASSPDWFVGVSGLNLRGNGEWRDDVTVPLAVYDAGTDSGASYTAANTPTTPPDPIAALTSSPFDQLMIVGEYRFVRQ